MRLDIYPRRMVERFRRRYSGGGGRNRQVRRIVCHRPGAVISVRTRELEVHIDVDQLMLNRLEQADGSPEGKSVLRVVNHHIEGGLCTADLLESQINRRPIENLSRKRPALPGRTLKPPRRAVDRDLRVRARGINRRDHLTTETVRREVDQHKRESLVASLRHACHDNGKIGNIAVQDR